MTTKRKEHTAFSLLLITALCCFFLAACGSGTKTPSARELCENIQSGGDLAYAVNVLYTLSYPSEEARLTENIPEEEGFVSTYNISYDVQSTDSLSYAEGTEYYGWQEGTDEKDASDTTQAIQIWTVKSEDGNTAYVSDGTEDWYKQAADDGLEDAIADTLNWCRTASMDGLSMENLEELFLLTGTTDIGNIPVLSLVSQGLAKDATANIQLSFDRTDNTLFAASFTVTSQTDLGDGTENMPSDFYCSVTIQMDEPDGKLEMPDGIIEKAEELENLYDGADMLPEDTLSGNNTEENTKTISDNN